MNLPFRAGVLEENEKYPDPKEILSKANELPELPVSIQVSDYNDAIEVLRVKGYLWTEITEWLNSNGVKFSYQAIRNSYGKLSIK